ncbi:hypothetical protein [Mycobacterium sp.]|uniref:hypothetical protein n=1 Tax=Mycobacterium sp. TaxID=1785 RepID=UPI0031D14520
MDIIDTIIPLFASEINKYNKEEMRYAVKYNIDVSYGVLSRIKDYEETYKIIKPLIRVYWGQLKYLFDNPKPIINYIKEANPALFEINGSTTYVTEQIQKSGYLLYDYITSNTKTKVQVKLKKKETKYKNKKNKD